MQEHSFDQAEKNPGIVTNMPTNRVHWSSGRNVSFAPGLVFSIPGKELIDNTITTPVRAAFTFKGWDGNLRTIICTDSEIKCLTYSGVATVTDITPTPPPTSGSQDVWECSIVAGLVVVTNGKDGVWKWGDYTAPLEPLAGAPVVCRHIGTWMRRFVFADFQGEA